MLKLTSLDGTEIVYTMTGSGPSVVMVGGALDDGSENATLIPHLAQRFTVYNYVRRGRGESGDTAPHSLTRELDDLAGVVKQAGGSAHLFGASSGGALVLEAVAAGVAATSIAVYDVPYSVRPGAIAAWQTYASDVQKAIADDDRDRAVELFMRVAGLPDEAIAEVRASPFWTPLLALAHTLPYDAACLNDGPPPHERLASIQQSALVVTRETPDQVMVTAGGDFFAAAADAIAGSIPTSRRATVAAASHAVDPDALAPVLADFFKRP